MRAAAYRRATFKREQAPLWLIVFYPPQNKRNKLRGIKDRLCDQAPATHLTEAFCLNEYFDWTRGSNMSSERAEESGLFSKNAGHLSRPARDVEHRGSFRLILCGHVQVRAHAHAHTHTHTHTRLIPKLNRISFISILVRFFFQPLISFNHRPIE